MPTGPLPPGCHFTSGDMFFDPDLGREFYYNPGSSDNCHGPAFLKYMEAQPESVAKRRKEEQRQTRASDMKALGPVIGKLAQVIRKRRAKSLNPETRALAKSLRARRRRSIKAD